MRQKDIGAWLVQETWEEGVEYDVDIGGNRVFHHNSMRGNNGQQHLFKGVAIILLSTFHTARKAAGSPPPVTTDPKDDFAGRIICLDVIFDLLDNRGKKIKGKSLPLALVSVYFPCNVPQHDHFCLMLDSMLNAISPSTQIIIGSDINARIGTCSCEEHRQVLGSFGIKRNNAHGKNLLHILGSHNLRVETRSSSTGQKNMSHTPVFPQAPTLMVFQVCTIYLPALSPFTNGSRTVSWCYMELPAITRLSNYASPCHQ